MFLKNTICIFKNFSTIAEQKIWIYQNFGATLEHTHTQTSFITTGKKEGILPVGQAQVEDCQQKAWATTIVAPKWVQSTTTKEEVSLTESKAGREQPKQCPKHSIVSSILAGH